MRLNPREHHLRLASALLILIVCLTAASPNANADRGQRTLRAPSPDDVFVSEGRGCYWSRGTMTCSRFCYLEIDGRRYCTERSEQAFPQALPYFWAGQYGGRPERYRPRVEVAPDYRGRRHIPAPRLDVE
ncbi:MAG: hypothetical protein CTY20_11785 [Hyphomicrobium sp.]|nr:MAG: hypothetical protein CTY20_11785 [Hyphomicrobium sp.]